MYTNQQILISVVIPTFNRAHLLSRCITSIINQSYKNLEIIIIDDFSTDNTIEIIKNFEKNDHRIKYLKSTTKGGNNARNTGIFAAKGEYIALMDDDDKSLNNRIESQINVVINSNFKYDFIVSGYEIRDEKEHLISTINYLKPLQSIGFPSRWLVKSDKLKSVGGFDPQQPAIQEIELFWRLREICSIYFDPTIVLELIDSPISVSKNSDNMIKGIKRLLELYGNKMNKIEYNSWIKTMGNNGIKKNDKELIKYSLKNINLKSLFIFDLLLLIGWITKLKIFIRLNNFFTNLYYKKNQLSTYKK